MKIKLTMIATICAGLALANSAPAKKYSKEDYIALWKDVAIDNQRDFKVPASITLAQGILESGFGNSELAQKANNHFGIKCHNWGGDSFYMDDDRKDECFRKYTDASQSYADHSTFLTSRSRYASLFELEITDYKSWAKGLKKAGYATNPKYPVLLIKIIEENNLSQYDKAFGNVQVEDVATNTPTVTPEIEIEVSNAGNEVKIHKNNIKFIIAKQGDTYYKIAKANQMNLMQLYSYNDYSSKKEYLNAGDIVFLQPKRSKSKSKEKTMEISKPMNLRFVSQLQGIKLRKLKKLNPSINDVDKELTPGVKVFLK